MSDKKVEVQENQEGGDRRNLLRNSAIVAGAAAALGAASRSSAASYCEEPRLAEKKTFACKFDARHKVNIKHVYDVLDQIFDAAGCTTCGLNGVDIRLELDILHDIRTDVPVNVSTEF